MSLNLMILLSKIIVSLRFQIARAINCLLKPKETHSINHNLFKNLTPFIKSRIMKTLSYKNRMAQLKIVKTTSKINNNKFLLT